MVGMEKLGILGMRSFERPRLRAPASEIGVAGDVFYC